jgi:hypothetical protein
VSCARLAWVLLFWCGACTSETLVIATRERAAEDAMQPMDAGEEDAEPAEDAGVWACVDDTDCLDGMFCEKASCDAVNGLCESRPTVCAAQEAPVCGCDGISYFNDCLRRASGIASSTQGECGRRAQLCGGFGGEGCPGDAYCSRIDASSRACDPGGPSPPGKCWILPAVCASSGLSGDRFIACAQVDPLAPPGEWGCVNACEAIRSEQPHLRALRCGDPPRNRPGQMFAP